MASTETVVTMSSCGVTPHNQEWGVGVSGNVEAPSPYDRINRLRQTYQQTKWTIDHERACLVTEAYKKFNGLTQQQKVAHTLAHVLRNVTIRIYEDELIVGEMGAPDKAAPVFPEFSYSWITNELRDFPFEEREATRQYVSEETKNKLLEMEEFWTDNTLDARIVGMMSDDEIKGTHLGRGVYALNLYMHGGIGHVCPYYPKLFELGYGGLKRQVEEKLAQLDPTLPEDLAKREFYQAELIVLDGVIDFCKRYAQLAFEMAKTATGQRKKELVRIAENCSWIAENPPRTFWEALQLWTLAYHVTQIESNGHSVSFGRFDQYMYPYYKNDTTNGTATKDFIQELIECAYMKFSQVCKLRDKDTVRINGGHGLGGTTITLGGVDKDGKDATNDLTFMSVDAVIHTRLTEPWVLVRWNANTPKELKIKCANAIKVGSGRPKLFNDEITIPAMTDYGRSLEDSRDYTVVGCVEMDTAGREYGWHDAAYFSIAKILELAINNGRCIGCEVMAKDMCPRYAVCAAVGNRLGIETGSLADFKDFEGVKEAYDKQMKYFVDLMIAGINVMDIAHQRYMPLPYLSLLVDDCIEKGVDVSAGGAKYNFTGPQAVGVGTVADGLSAIKQLVYDEKKISGKEFLQAVSQNWEGYEWLYALVNSDKVHHYGNDDDYADELAKWASDVYCKHVEHKPNARGGVFAPGVYTVTANVGLGEAQWASPDGRKAGEPVSDNVGAVHTQAGSHDTNGPTAMVKSVAKLGHRRFGNGTLLNMKFSPTSVSGQIGTENLISVIDTYFEKGGMHCQFNVLSKETLEDAYENPERHTGLIVRVAGYSAFFNDLSNPTKQDIIGRTELSFD